ncbi:MAG: prolyl oligopeptidase family serine peptidase [Verrucomicrobia bacterium]|nr:prolyl oligopeptidase family serine peptidase [Verrucomicrobiota bacterium]
MDQIVRMVQTLSKTYSIDPDRIYVTGISMGGYGSWGIINRYPFFFAAAVPMSGGGLSNYQRITHIPIWCFHAAKDETVDVSGSDNAVSGARLAGARVIYTRYADGSHAIWLAAYANPRLLPWLMAQRRNRPAAVDPFVQITSPANRFVPASADSTRNVSGTASLTGGINQVN